MFFKDKVHIQEVIKWGVLAGLFEGLYIGIATLLYAYRHVLVALAGGWSGATTFILVGLITVSAIVTSVIVFAHPIYSLLHKNFRDGLLTVVISIVTVIAVIGFVLFSYQKVLS